MANFADPQLVPAPARVAAPYGLFSVLAFREPDDRHWELAGTRWETFDGATPLGVVGTIQTDPSQTVGLPKSFVTDTTIDRAGVFTVYGSQKVTPGAAWNADSARDRARDVLIALEERSIEAVLSGELGTLTPNLGEAIPLGNETSILEAVAELEDFLSNNYGSRGVIHVSRGNALRGIKQDAFETRNNGLFTKIGTPVVAGKGYPRDVVFSTSALIGYRSEIFENTSRAYDLLDKNTNDLYAIAERTYCIGFEAAALGAVTIGDSPA